MKYNNNKLITIHLLIIITIKIKLNSNKLAQIIDKIVKQ